MRSNLRAEIWAKLFERASCLWIPLLLQALGCLTGLPQSSFAETPREELLKLVEPEAAVVIEVVDLQNQRKQLLEAEWWNRAQKTSLFTILTNTPEFRKLKSIGQQLERASGKTWEELFDGVVGQAVIFAVYVPGTQEPQGMLLIRARDEEILDAALKAWGKLDPNKEVLNHEYQGVTFLERTGDHPIYLFRKGVVLVVSDHLGVIEGVIDQTLGTSTGPLPSLANSELYRDCYRTLKHGPLVSLFVNARAWDDVLSPASEDKRVMAAWNSIRGLQFGLSSSDGIHLEAVALLDRNLLPPKWEERIARLQGFPETFTRVPSNVLAAFGGKHDLETWGRLVVHALPPKKGASLRGVLRGFLAGKDLIDDVFHNLEPNWGGYLIENQTQPVEGIAHPIHAALVFQLPDRAENEALHGALENGLSTAWNLLSTAIPEEDVSVETIERENVLLRYIRQKGSIQPAFLLSRRSLWFATSPDLLPELPPVKVLTEDPTFRYCQEKHLGDSSQVLYLPLASWKSFSNRLPDEKQRKHLIEAFGIFDAAYLAAEAGPETIRLGLGVVAVPKEVNK